jgi:hypothetical protein
MNARFEPAHGAQVNRQKIEKKRAVSFCREGNHFPFLRGSRVVIDPLQVGGLSAQTWTVVNQLAINFASRKVDKRHGLSGRTGHSFIAYACKQANPQTNRSCSEGIGGIPGRCANFPAAGAILRETSFPEGKAGICCVQPDGGEAHLWGGLKRTGIQMAILSDVSNAKNKEIDLYFTHNSA